MPEFKKITNGIRKCKLRLATVVASNTSKRKIYKKLTNENRAKNRAKTEQKQSGESAILTQTLDQESRVR